MIGKYKLPLITNLVYTKKNERHVIFSEEKSVREGYLFYKEEIM
jgi:hypothetical protein